MPKRVRVVTSNDLPITTPKRTVIAADNPTGSTRLTENEIKARVNRRYATTTTMGGFSRRGSGGDITDSGSAQFYSPQLSTDFLEKPQNLRERRAFYRFFYNTNEIIGQAVDIHSTLPMSKLRLVPPKGKNKHQNEYVYKYFVNMCEDMKLFKTLIEGSHEYHLFGNCLARWAEVPIPGGFKRADQIQVGDLVLTDQGRFRPVKIICDRPSEKILDIKCWRDFRSLPVTDEHPIEIYRDGQFVFEKAENISIKDYIRVSYPTEVADIDSYILEFPETYKKIDCGYETEVKISHPKSTESLKARKGFLSWLCSLESETIKTRSQIAEDIGVSVSVLHHIIDSLDDELDEPFHKRIGASGWQKGSQTVWIPIKNKNIEVKESYTIIRKNVLNSVDSVSIDNDFSYLAGYWLGGGTLARDNSRITTWGRGLWQITFSEQETDNIDRIRNILIKIFGENSVTEWVSNTIHYLKVISNPAFLEWWAINFGETSFGTNNKKVPEWLSKLPTEKLKYFLAGLIDSDDCISVSEEKQNVSVNITTASRSIMDEVRNIALKCGAIVSYMEKPERDVILPDGSHSVSRKMYALTSSDEESCLILSEYSSKSIPEDSYFAENRYYIRTENGLAFKVKSVSSEEYMDLVYNYEVEEDHTYSVAGFSTHNCFFFAEEDDWKDNLSPTEIAKKKEEAQQKSEFLDKKYEVKDKNPLYKGWKKLLILPPDQVRVRKLPLSDEVAVEYMPDPETRRFLTSDYPTDPSDPTQKVHSDISEELKQKVRQSGVIPLDTDPNSGSHVYHLARKKSQYEPLGVSMIERCVNTLVLMDKLRQAQTSIASRHMTPMRIVWADQLSNEDIDNLREQVDLALVDPDFSIIANYEIHWEEMGSQGRLLDVTSESEDSMNRLFAGMGVTREILTGEGSYTGSRISLEIMNNMYLLFREQIQDYVENYIFKPVAKKKGFIEYDDYGNEVILYPRLSFTRLAIRDNDQFFDAAFQMYQKGSISVDLILDILNIDPDSTKEKIEKDLFTVNDSLFNEVMRNIYTSAAVPLVEKTDLVDKLAKYLKLDVVEGAPPAEGEARFSSVKKEDLGTDHAVKLAKLVKYMNSNPKALDKMFQSQGKTE